MKFPKKITVKLKPLIVGILCPFFVMGELVVTIGGDVNFNKTSFYVHPDGFSPSNSTRGDDVIPWAYYTEQLKPLLTGDLNFANIETVVTNNNSLIAEQKKFKFRTHPNAIRHLLEIGFNFFSIANNHSYDFKRSGMEETLKHLQSLNSLSPIYYHGIGKRADLLEPKIFNLKGYRIAFAAISIVEKDYRASADKMGLLHITNNQDYYDLVKSFKQVEADLKIISIHYGQEGKVSLDARQKQYYEYAIDNGGVDLIIGHHPHAVRPISLYKNKLIFYSLGNYLMLGSANITKKQGGADWGLFAKIVYSKQKEMLLEAVELQPLTQTHSQVRPLTGKLAKERLREYSKLNLRELAEVALPWDIKDIGKGVYCSRNFQEKTSMEICH